MAGSVIPARKVVIKKASLLGSFFLFEFIHKILISQLGKFVFIAAAVILAAYMLHLVFQSAFAGYETVYFHMFQVFLFSRRNQKRNIQNLLSYANAFKSAFLEFYFSVERQKEVENN